jgi:hypothetical protein
MTSGAGRLRDVKAVLQHLEARYDIACDRQDDRELCRGDLAGRLDPSLECTDDRCAALAGEDVFDIEGDGPVNVRILRMKSAIALRTVLRPIQGSTPASPWISNMRSTSNRAAISTGSWPTRIPFRSFCAMAMYR